MELCWEHQSPFVIAFRITCCDSNFGPDWLHDRIPFNIRNTFDLCTIFHWVPFGFLIALLLSPYAWSWRAFPQPMLLLDGPDFCTIFHWVPFGFPIAFLLSAYAWSWRAFPQPMILLDAPSFYLPEPIWLTNGFLLGSFWDPTSETQDFQTQEFLLWKIAHELSK